jgi:DNA polymerase III delta prime subunit
MLDKVQKILYKKFKEDKLAHFYLVEPSIVDNESKLLSWCSELILEMNDLFNKDILNQPDILILQPDANAKQYSIDQISEIFNFTMYNPLSLSKKYLIIPEAHKLSPIHSNKLLKTFEEPPIGLNIFLLNPQKSKILNTIESRSIKLRVALTPSEAVNNIKALMDEKPDLQSFTTKLASLKLSYEVMYSELISIISENNLSSVQMGHIKKELDNLTQDVIYNSSWPNKAFKIYSLLNSLK